MRISLILIAALLAGCEPAGSTNQSVLPKYDLLSTCERPARPGLASIYEDSLCGSVSVFEDRDRAAGRKIDLNLMVIKARTPNPRPDPVFYLAGGPGQAATDIGPMIASLMDPLRLDRDIVLVDQRGTGKSNPLDCINDDEALDPLATMEDIARVQVDTMRNCLGQWDADPSLYTTPIAMDDLNEVRETLGFDQINLYGVSYGTRAALVYLRRHEESVRTMILDSVVPMTMPIPDQVAVDAQSAFDLMLKDCAEDQTCAAAFPKLQQQFDQLMADLRTHPRQVTLEHPVTGERLEATLEAAMLTRVIRTILYDRDLTSLLPLAITEAAKDNYKPLFALSIAFSGGRSQGELMSLGMMTSVLCAEDMTRSTGPNDTADFDNAIYYSIEPLCRFWPTGTVDENYFQPVSSDVPVLLVSGMLDPITPPRYGFEAEKTLKNSTHVLVPGIGHGVTHKGCMPEMLAQFLENGSAANIDLGCMADFKRPPFFVSFAGTIIPEAGND